MKPLIGILAPNAGDSQYHSGFRVRLKQSGQDLSLRNLHALFESSYDVESLRDRAAYDSVAMPAAGYYLTGLLRANGYDTCLTSHTDEDAYRTMAARSPFAICISTSMIISVDYLARVVAGVRAAMPDVPIIVGGPLIWKALTMRTTFKFSSFLESAVDENPVIRDQWSLLSCHKRDLDVDVMIVSPHGASILLDVLRELGKGSRADLTTIPNLNIPDATGTFVPTARAEEPIDWNADFTRWDLVDELPPWIPVRTSIGCPFRCEFCDFCHMLPKAFLRSTASLSEELALVKSRAARSIIHVTDDIVFASQRRLREVCQTFIESRAVLMWGGFLRAARFIPEEMELIRKSGFRWGLMGVESGDQNQLDRMNKKQKLEILRESLESLDRADISTLMTLIVGFPGENDESVANTIEFLSTLDVANACYEIFPLWVFPLSGLANPELRNRWRLEGFGDDWSHETMDRSGAEAACEHVFRSARWVPYNYPDESVVFNARWSRPQRRELFELRRQLTVELMGGSSGERVRNTLEAMAGAMDVPYVPPPDSWLTNLEVCHQPRER